MSNQSMLQPLSCLGPITQNIRLGKGLHIFVANPLPNYESLQQTFFWRHLMRLYKYRL